MSIRSAVAYFAVVLVFAVPAIQARAESARNPQWLLDPTGLIETYSTQGPILTNGAFFQSLGTNGRSCATCHVASQGFGLSAAAVRRRFAASAGKDALFAPVDGANCPTVRGGNPADHSLLLGAGVIRIGLPVLPSYQFTMNIISDPYGCAIAPDALTGLPDYSVYRRPLPTTNLSFLSAVMFDGRETIAPLNVTATFPANLAADLTHQAIDAVLTHAQAQTPPSQAQLADIVNFELGLFSAQGYDFIVGDLGAHGAAGGATNLAAQAYYPGINDSLGADPSGASFDPTSMTLFASWAGLTGGDGLIEFLRNDVRRQIAAGEALFNSFPITIVNVRGLNDNPALGKPTSFVGHCTTCHDAPNVGDHSLPLPLDIGTSHSPNPEYETDPAIVAALAELSMPNLPLYLIGGCANPFTAGQPASFYTSDPGKALITGSCGDLNRVKGPILRGLAARAPYFHNGAAANLTQVVNFYNQRFGMGLSKAQKIELVAFLNSL